jgi:CHAT domain-containing protein/predicted negative regulator of RcsB-dependent stress response
MVRCLRGDILKRKKGMFFILFCFFCFLVFGQEKQADNDKKLKEEILAVYKSSGEEGLRDFVKDDEDKIPKKFIVKLSESGVNERKQEWLNISVVIAEEINDQKTMAGVYYNLGDYFRLISNDGKAKEYFNKAFTFYKQINFVSGQAKTCLGLGDIYLNSSDNKNALKMYDKALTLSSKSGYNLGIGYANVSIGSIHFFSGKNSKALEHYDRAMNVFKRIGNTYAQGVVHLYKGIVYFNIGNNSEALENYDNAMTFFEKEKSFHSQAHIYLKKGNIYFRIGNNLKSLEMYNNALNFFEKTGSLSGQANVYLDMGEIYIRTGENSKALDIYDKALIIYKKIKEPGGQGNVYLSKGDVFLMIGKNSKALEMYDKALTLYNKSKEPISLGNAFRRKGYIYFLNGDNLKALETYDKAMAFYKKAEEPVGQGNVLKGKGEIYFSGGNYSKALEMYETALALYKKSGAILPLSNTLYKKAKILEQQGKKDEALEYFEGSISHLDKIRIQTAFSGMKKTFMEKVYDQYEETTAFMLKNKYYERGFTYVESMKSRVFLDRLAEGLVTLDKGITPELKQKSGNLVSRLSILSKEMNEAAGKNNEKKLKELKDQYQNVQNEFEELLIKIRLNNPLYASVRYPEPITVQELQKNVLEKEDLLVRYFISRDNVYVFLIPKKDFNVITLDVKEKDINKIVSEYLFSIEAKNSRKVMKYGRQLYRQLVKPLESFIKDRKEIIIIPDGPLAKIPFESLVIDNKMSRKAVYLLEKYRVKYIQSTSILAILRKHYQRDSATKHFIGFGDPVYDYNNFELEKTEVGTPTTLNQDAISGIHRSRYEREGGIFTRLKSSGDEVNVISNLFKKQSKKCAVHLRQDANEANAKSPNIKEFDYIHFACHAVLGDGFQSLVLSQLPKSAEDGYFTLNEIMNCDYNAKLVVLSACQTGKGKMEKGEGVTGLTQAVMYAGTPAVVASLWNVEDISTKELMVKFYKFMLEGDLDKADSLRKAKLDLIKSKKYSSPFFWSAFVMYGE